jgi:glycosyltransferase involved in cell wall biosynthesis
MRVQVNGRYLVQRITGQQRYAREIVARLGDKVRVITPRGAPKGARGHLWEQAVLPFRLGRGLLWSPSATGPLSVSRQVVTVHDCAFLEQAHCFSRAFAAWYQYLVPRLVRKVRRTITVSEFSKQRIVELCRVPPDRVVAIHSGVDPRFRAHSVDETASVRALLNLPARYMLCVGSLEPRKNLLRLLQAWQRVQPRLEGLSLVLAGAKGHVFGDLGLPTQPPGVHVSGYLSDELLPAVYAGAEFFIYPSIYEGFGLPVIEAMASGAPVITSGVTALPEVAGDAALYVDPWNVESISSAIERLAGDAALRSQLRQQGLQRAARFKWESTVAATWQAFEAAV